MLMLRPRICENDKLPVRIYFNSEVWKRSPRCFIHVCSRFGDYRKAKRMMSLLSAWTQVLQYCHSSYLILDILNLYKFLIIAQMRQLISACYWIERLSPILLYTFVGCILQCCCLSWYDYCSVAQQGLS